MIIRCIKISNIHQSLINDNILSFLPFQMAIFIVLLYACVEEAIFLKSMFLLSLLKF